MRRSGVLLLTMAAALAIALMNPGWTQAPPPAGRAPGTAATSVSYDFESDAVGQPPAGWSMEVYNGLHAQEGIGGYQVVAADGGQALQFTGPDKPGLEYGFLILGTGDVQDGHLSVRMKFLGGMGANPGARQPAVGWAAGGLFFRYQDQADHYRARLQMEPGERVGGLYFYLSHADQVVGETTLPLPYGLPSGWHTLDVRFQGTHLTYTLDGRTIYDGNNSVFMGPGKVGLFVPRGTTALFDDFRLEVVSRKPPAVQPATYTSSTGWAADTVARGPRVYAQASLAVDSGGVPHVASFDLEKGNFRHHWLESGAWKTETVNPEPYLPVPQVHDLPPFPLTVMEIGSDDQPQLVYIKPFTSRQDRYAGSPMIARRNPAPPPDQVQPGQSAEPYWYVAPAAPDQGGLGWYPGLFTAPGRESAAFFVDIQGLKVRMSQPVADPVDPEHAWKAQAVADYKGEPSKAAEGRVFGWVTADGRVVLSYLDTQTTTLYVLTGEEGSASFTSSKQDFQEAEIPRRMNVDRLTSAGKYPSCARDFATGRVHTTHYEGSEQRLLYTPWHDGKFGATEVVDDDGAVGMLSSVVLDTHGNPHVVYCDVGDGTLRYAVRRDEKWKVEDTLLVGTYPSLRVTPEGQVHLVFYDPLADSVRHAVK